MTSIRGRLQTGLVIGTLAALAIAGAATDQAVRGTLMDDLDRSLRERGRWVASTVELSSDSLELGFRELEMGEFEPGRGASLLQFWRAGEAVLHRSPSLHGLDLARPRLAAGQEAFALERIRDGRRVRSFRACFVARVDPEMERPQPAPVVEMSLGRDLAGIDALVARLRAWLAAVGLAAALLAIGVLRWAVHRGLRPLERVATAIGRLDERDLSLRVSGEDTPLELEPVVRRLNELLGRLGAAFERERTFSADIAHELRTPLAGLRSTLEVELSRPREADRYRQALSESLGITLHMQDLVQTLLHLARFDAGLIRVDRVPTDFAELTRVALELLRARAAERRLDLRIELPRSSLVDTDPVLLGAAIRNVLDNAISHADEGGQVRIGIAVEGGFARLHVANTGAHTTTADVSRLFDRFVRGDAARPSGDGHHGLGLPLVRRIAEALGGRVDVRSEPGGEFRLTLDVPGPERTDRST